MLLCFAAQSNCAVAASLCFLNSQILLFAGANLTCLVCLWCGSFGQQLATPAYSDPFVLVIRTTEGKKIGAYGSHRLVGVNSRFAGNGETLLFSLYVVRACEQDFQIATSHFPPVEQFWRDLAFTSVLVYLLQISCCANLRMQLPTSALNFALLVCDRAVSGVWRRKRASTVAGPVSRAWPKRGLTYVC